MRFSHGRTHQPCLSDMPPRPKILNLVAGIFVRGATPDKQIKYGPLAQWLEQATHNRTVTGSNPVGATNSLSHIKISAVELLLRAHLYACLVHIRVNVGLSTGRACYPQRGKSWSGTEL